MAKMKILSKCPVQDFDISLGLFAKEVLPKCV